MGLKDFENNKSFFAVKGGGEGGCTFIGNEISHKILPTLRYLIT